MAARSGARILAVAALAGLVAAAPAQAAVEVELGVFGSGCQGVLYVDAGEFPEGNLCARNGLIVGSETQRYDLVGHALGKRLEPGTAGTLFLLIGDREPDPSDPPGPGGRGSPADLPNPDLRIHVALLAVATEDLGRDVDDAAVHADSVIAEGEGPCPHLQRLDRCTIELTVRPVVVPPTSRLELQLTTSNELPMSATIQVGGDEPSRIDLPEAVLVPAGAAPAEAAPPPAKESPALPSLPLLAAVGLLAVGLRRRGA